MSDNLLGRWDRRKRPEIFFQLAKQFPDVHFIAIGKSRDKAYDSYLREKYAEVPNLQMTGFLDQFNSTEVANILNQSWILINTASWEGLPNSFIKAASHQCAKIRAVNQDGFAREFGFHVKDDNFLAALDFLLSDNRWQQKGLQGYKYGKNAMNKMGRSANTMKFIETYRGFSNAYTSFTHRYRCC